MDDDQSGGLSINEFGKACRDFKVGISDENVPILFNAFDMNHDGTLQIQEFLNVLRGQMSNKRQSAVERAWSCLDRFNRNLVDFNVLRN